LGLACAYAGVTLPVWLTNTLSLLSSLTIPLMLLMLGTSLARIQVTGFPRARRLSVLRIGMGTVAGFTLAGLFGLRAGADRIRAAMRDAGGGVQLSVRANVQQRSGGRGEPSDRLDRAVGCDDADRLGDPGALIYLSDPIHKRRCSHRAGNSALPASST
jgi:hypothetical protein